jgi:hypothetical protein
VERKVSDVVQLLCRLSEAPNEIFRVGAMGRESEDGLRTLANLGVVSAGPRPDSITCQACYAHHFAALEFDAQARGYIYFCPEAGWVAAEDADLAVVRFDPEWLVAWLVRSLAMTSPTRRHALLPGRILPGRIWHLGDASSGGTLVTVVLARLISSQAALDELASMLVNIRPKEKGLVVTTSSQVALQVQLPHGFAFLDLREIGRMVGSHLMVDKARLASFVNALPNRSNRRQRTITAVHKKRREPERLDYRESDRLLIAEMRHMILTGKARNPTDAARALAPRAAGSGTDASKVTRLVMRYNEPP